MKIKEYKNKIVLAELDPKATYIMLYNVTQVPFEVIKSIQPKDAPMIYIVPTEDIDKTLKFVEIPKKK